MLDLVGRRLGLVLDSLGKLFVFGRSVSCECIWINFVVSANNSVVCCVCEVCLAVFVDGGF